MKNRIISLFVGLIGIIGCTEAQSVYIDDQYFVDFLVSQGFGPCISGHYLDTTCLYSGHDTNGVYTTYTGGPYMTITGNMYTIEGLQYFTFLQDISVGGPNLLAIFELPPNLRTLNVGGSNLTYLPPQLPNTLTQLHINMPGNYTCQISPLPALPNSLEELYIANDTALTSLPALPPNLSTIYIEGPGLTTLPTLPASLNSLTIDMTNITSLPTLPPNLQILNYDDHWLTPQPAWPASLINLSCKNTNINSITSLPPHLQTIDIGYNNLTSLPALPSTMTFLRVNLNQITSLPSLPAGLTYLDCSANNISALPTLPNTLATLYCNTNHLTTLPLLPAGLKDINCNANQITSIPPLPAVMTNFDCGNNLPLTCLPPFQKITNFRFFNTGITCLPSYGTVTNSIPALSTVPLCTTFNTHGCTPFWNLAGQAYYTNNNNCLFDSSDVGIGNVKMMMYQGGVLQQQTFTGGDGFYSFDLHNVYGTYTTIADTASLPFYVSCPTSGLDTSVISVADSFYTHNDFALRCKPGYDVGVNSLYPSNRPRPARPLTLKTIAGDISQLIYKAHCASGISGQVQLSYTGALHYTSMATGGIAPSSVTGNTITWNIADFATVVADTSFITNFMVDTTAPIGSNVCFTVTVNSSGSDNNLNNNTLTYCDAVINSYDPNEKDVFPTIVSDTTKKWFTYTVRFQNVGTASAINIYVQDTLDSNLDASSIELLTYSHHNITQVLSGGIVRFNFPNINLADSAHNEPASHGYVQYKIKIKNGLPTPTVIHNTASIYFDFNSPVVTNTASTTYGALLPTITPSQPVALCQGDSSILQASVTGNFPIQWLKNGLPIASETNGSYIAKNAGAYSLRIYYAGDSATSTATTVTVNALPNVSVGAAANTVCANNSPVTLTPSPTGGTFTGTGVTGNSFNPAQGVVGSNTINYSYTDANNCSNNASTTISVNALPSVTLSAAANTVCINGTAITLTSSPNGGTLSGTGITGNTFNPAQGTVGTNTINYNYTDANSCSNSATTTITVNALPNITLFAAANSVCTNGTAITLISSPNGGTLSGTGITGNSFDPAQGTVGSNTISYNYTDANNCSNNATTTITVNALPNVTLSAAANSVCANGTPIALTPSPAGGSYFGAGVVGNTFDPTQANLGTSPISYTYTDGNNCSNSATANITVYALPTVTLNPDTNITYSCKPPIQLNGTPSGGYYAGSGITDSIFNPSHAQGGIDTIEYHYTDGNGCSAVAKTTIENFICVGIENTVNSFDINIFPNPTNDAVNISIKGGENFTVNLFSINGLLLQTQTINSGISTIDMSNLASGIYYFEFANMQGKVIKKVVKM